MFIFVCLQLIHHVLKCRLECIKEHLLIHGNAQNVRLAANAVKQKTTKCFIAYNVTEAFIFIVWD